MRSYLQHGRRHGPTGSDPITGIPRIVAGGFYGSDIVNAGSGDWTVDYADGIVTVTFNDPFGSPPTITATAGAGNDNANGIPVINADTDGDEFADHFTLCIHLGDAGTNGWYFHAIGDF